MRLLLDEHYPARLAERLRALGCDAVAVQERPDLRGCADAELLRRMRAEGRAIVTEDRGDFGRLLKRRHDDLGDHGGLVLVVPGRFPHTPAGLAALATALHALAVEAPAEVGVPGWVGGLSPPPAP